MRNRTFALTTALLATAVAVPALAAPPAAPGRPGSDVVAPDETGCRDVIDGSVNYQQLIASITQEEYKPGTGESLGMYQSRVVTVRPKGVATAGVVLAAPSCVDVDYTIEVRTLDGQLLASHTQRGDGVSGTAESPLMVEAVVGNHASKSIALRVTTSNGGTTHDVAPDADAPPAEATAAEDGLPGGGATSSFK